MANYNHKDVLVYFLVRDLTVKTAKGRVWNYALFNWERDYISYWVGREEDSVHWAIDTLKKKQLPWVQIKELHRADWEKIDTEQANPIFLRRIRDEWTHESRT